jgi:hypothetical protein
MKTPNIPNRLVVQCLIHLYHQIEGRKFPVRRIQHAYARQHGVHPEDETLKFFTARNP